MRHEFESENNNQIFLLAVVNRLSCSWKKLVVVALSGGILGLCWWFLTLSYVADISLRNNDAMGILALKSLQARLPNLAAEIIKRKQIPEGQSDIYDLMGDPDFWKKGLTPSFSLTKSEIKDLGIDSKGDNNPILYLVIHASGKSEDLALKNANAIVQFVREGGAFIVIRDMVRAQESDLLAMQASISSKMSDALVELEYQKQRLKGLEDLARRFPVESRSGSRVVDAKDSGAKYLPINTQIIAINTDINIYHETLMRLRDQQAQEGQIKRWLELATPLIEKNYNGLELSQKLLVLEEQLRGEIKGADPTNYVFVNNLRAKLLSNMARFQRGLEDGGSAVFPRSSMLKYVFGCSFVALLLASFFLLGQLIWLDIKKEGRSARE